VGAIVASALALSRFGSMIPVFIVLSAGSYTSRTIHPVESASVTSASITET
jgi:hypothetical protein